MVDIIFKRTGPENTRGGVPGELTIGKNVWPTIERGGGYTFARKGEYTLKMDMKATGRRVKCLRFDHDGIRTHLIHDALNDNHMNLAGCIAPGQKATEEGIEGSEKAMAEVFLSLGGFVQGATKTIMIENNISGNETGEQWKRRRKAEGKY